MAGKKPSEANILYQCLECHRHRVISNGVDGKQCNYCDGHLNPIGPTNLPTTKEGKKTIHYGGITITADVSDALKGLKAVQREARKATRSLKELEEQQKKYQSLPIGIIGSAGKFEDNFKSVIKLFGDKHE